MVVAKSIAEARSDFTHIVHDDGRESWVSRFFNATPEEPERPVAFLVDKKAHGIVPPHFHEVNQFQIIAQGSGWLGKQDVQPFTVHYTNGFTGYGPICADEEGISFFTLRNRYNPGGAHYFPEGRSFMKPAPRRHRVSDHLELSKTEALKSRQDEVLETVFEPESDGLAAWFLRAIPGTITHAPSPDQGGGQYVVVAGGTLVHDGG